MMNSFKIFVTATLCLLVGVSFAVGSGLTKAGVSPLQAPKGGLVFTISGHILDDGAGVAGVLLSGFPGDTTVTDSDGYYSASFEDVWSGTVVPVKAGYSFLPDSTVYTNAGSDLTDQDYAATVLQFQISGSVCFEVVAKSAMPASSCLQDVVMTGLPENPTTDSLGHFSDSVPYGWTGTVIPVAEGYVFSPDSIVYDSIKADKTDQDFTASTAQFTISGRVTLEQPTRTFALDDSGIADVEMTGLGKDPLTDSAGYYESKVDFGWSGTVIPVKAGYTFQPDSVVYDSVTGNVTTNYVAHRVYKTISGLIHGDVERVRRAVSPNEPSYDSVVMTGLPGNPLSDIDGSYSAQVEYGWSGTVIPTKPGFTFAPDSIVYTDVTDDQTDQNYVATALTFTISGYVHPDVPNKMVGKNLPGIDSVTMLGLPGDPISDSTGFYTATVSFGWSGVVTPTKAGLHFSPDSTVYDSVTANFTDQDYLGAVKTYTISGHVCITVTSAAASSKTACIDSVVMQGLPGDPMTDDEGFYTATVVEGWSGTVIPKLDAYTFAPDSIVYDSVIADQADQDYAATERPAGVRPDQAGRIPKEFALSQNFPNPFNPTTQIEFGLPRASFVTVKIYSIMGSEVTTLEENSLPAGTYQITWDGTDRYGRAVSTGVYLYRIEAGNYSQTKKMLLLK